jgi:hypothetical protein
MTTSRILTASSVLSLLLLTGARPAPQSGRGSMHGYVAFEDFSYNDVTEGKIKATVELGSTMPGSHGSIKTQTDNHGSYDFPGVGMGEYTLRITAPGHIPYQIELYIPSDFECRLAVMLKKAKSGP